MSNPLPVHRRAPNELSPKEYLKNTYGPQAQKTFAGALEAFFATEFPQLAGTHARRAVVLAIVNMVHQYFPATSHLRQGQTTWVTVAKDEVSSYGKSIPKTRMVPVVLSIMAEDEAQQRAAGKRLRDVKKEAVARLCQETDRQGGCVTAAELSILLKTTTVTVGKYIAEWQEEHGRLLPRRGSIHDMGPTLTHKKEICRLLFLEGKSVSETMRLTKHSPHAIDRYITNFRQVFTCKTKGLSVRETAHATRLSHRLVEEYLRLFDEYAVTNKRFDVLLKERSNS